MDQDDEEELIQHYIVSILFNNTIELLPPSIAQQINVHLFDDASEPIVSEQEQEESQEESQEEEGEIHASPLRREREEDTDEEPPKKYQKINPQINYTFISLNTLQTMRFREYHGTDLLLVSEPNLFVRKIISMVPTSIKSRLGFLSKFSLNDGEYSEADRSDDEDNNDDVEGKKRMLYNLRDQVYAAYIKECRLRTAFRKVLQMWRSYKMNKKQDAADVDPITLCVPEKEIQLYDWSARKKFVFDARSLATFIESKLLYCEGGFPLPQYPCNPWTNVEFTYNQLVSIYFQLKDHGELRWGLTTLRHYDFNKNVWHRYHSSALTVTAIKSSLIRLDTYDARELLMDFIFAKMDDMHVHTSRYIENAYRQAALHAPTHWYIEECKSIAIVHYEAAHFGYNKIALINSRCSKLFKRQGQMIREMVLRGIIRAR